MRIMVNGCYNCPLRTFEKCEAVKGIVVVKQYWNETIHDECPLLKEDISITFEIK